MGQFGIGQSVRRTEDQRLITGRGRYIDDMNFARQTYACFVRSPHAHARIAAIDTQAAATMPGVLAVLTGADYKQTGYGDIPCLFPTKNLDQTDHWVPPRPALVTDIARFAGDAVAVVVAETALQARDAAERVAVEYAELPSVTNPARALGGPVIWQQAPTNRVFHWASGRKAAVEDAFKQAAHVTTVELINNRVMPNSMETRGAIGDYDAGTDRYTLYTSSQGVHSLRRQLAMIVLKVPENHVRVVTPDVGGGFGMKIFLFPEQVVVMWAAKLLERPVKWISERSEGMLTDTHGRDHITKASLALDKDGRMLGLRVDTIANLGAYLSNFGPYIPTAAGCGMLCGVYTVPHVYVEVQGVYTNSCPVDAYRGAGRPEANYVIERLVDAAARELKIDPTELRKRNFIPPAAFPYKTAMGLTYDSGEFAENMARALKQSDRAGFAARKAESRKRGKLRGLGIAYYIEACGGAPEEKCEMRFDQTGTLTLLIGTQSNGQGHETAYAQIAADRLGLPIDKIRVVQGDSDAVSHGRGTGGSRSVPVGGVAVANAAERIIEKSKRIAAHALEAAEADVEFKDGVFKIVGTDRTMSLDDVVKLSFLAHKLPKGERPGMTESDFFMPSVQTFPNGCHVVEVEIDPATGTIEILRYTVVDDFGNLINPMLVAGQVHGGIGQGIGQALLERCVYDESNGQLLSASLMDYCMPRAADVPDIHFETNVVPCKTNPLGIKGAGEAGCIGAPPALINALVDALAEFGVRHVDMPATPETLWRLCQDAKAA
ncbi:MAG: xanthine dehydrogenase family protein molybdopterin-binding subunit [Alphaproteobacteria bacterium]